MRGHVSSRYIEVTRLALDENFHLLDACENIDVRNSFQVTFTQPPGSCSRPSPLQFVYDQMAYVVTASEASEVSLWKNALRRCIAKVASC